MLIQTCRMFFRDHWILELELYSACTSDLKMSSQRDVHYAKLRKLGI